MRILIDGARGQAVDEATEPCLDAADVLDELHTRIEQGDLDALRLQLAERLPRCTIGLRQAFRRELRARRQQSALALANGLDSLGTAGGLAASQMLLPHGVQLSVKRFAHLYGFERDYSELNDAGQVVLPAATFS